MCGPELTTFTYCNLRRTHFTCFTTTTMHTGRTTHMHGPLAPEPSGFILTESSHSLSICLWTEPQFWNGGFQRFVHEIMQFCCLGGAGTSCTLSEGVRHSYNRTIRIYVDWLKPLPIDIIMNGIPVLEWWFSEVCAWNYSILLSWSCWYFLYIVRKRLTL